MGVVVGADIPMVLGAMIMGPLAAFILKYIDGYVQQRTKSGFEMLVDNFSDGSVGLVMAVLGLLAVGPIVENIANAAGNVVQTLVNNNVLPLVSIIVEPAKVLFLNNAINHGVLAPLGVAQALQNGKSILFMIETNPGPGLGILLAYLFFGPRSLRPRSEEHTSELQSHSDLVCRLLLEKKNALSAITACSQSSRHHPI